MSTVVDCGDCSDFVESVHRHLGHLISRYGFRPVRCESERGGRECMWMLESDRCRLLFTLSDGAEDCSLGKVETRFPDWISFLLNGEIGWYNTRFLIELKTGKELLNRKLVNEFREGKRTYFEWISPLLEKWMPELIAMFDGHEELTWHGDLERMLEKRKPW